MGPDADLPGSATGPGIWCLTHRPTVSREQPDRPVYVSFHPSSSGHLVGVLGVWEVRVLVASRGAWSRPLHEAAFSRLLVHGEESGKHRACPAALYHRRIRSFLMTGRADSFHAHCIRVSNHARRVIFLVDATTTRRHKCGRQVRESHWSTWPVQMIVTVNSKVKE